MQIEPILAFEDNYIWALRKGGQVALVDPGEASPVERLLKQTGDQLSAIIVTHHHGDHIGGIAELVARYPVPVYGPAREAQAVVTHPLAEGDHVTLLGVDFAVMEVPGHTLGHIVYYARDGLLFCGDTLFGAGCGRVFEGTLAQMHTALARIAALPATTQVYCAHEYTESCLRFAKTVEPNNAAIAARIESVKCQRAARQPSVPSTLAEELATNPFLRWQAPGVIAAATAHLGHPPANDTETFSAIRIWRDQL
ncbi:MAG: hydroxyacylglutathione hydrolase [Rhodocyclaceae bacterium]|nr:hydroxyacylglutathione hydrolase [Rhodocyclaceae bacterium]MDZ4216455.1 hydroxyacylglutathione hydrolase [Rhodocyclaceae bacterium]